MDDNYLKKENWPDGAWHYEEDEYFWTDEATGCPCAIIRHPRLGHLCGYVAVPDGHPLHGKDYSDDAVNVQVHGGLTYARDHLAGTDRIDWKGLFVKRRWWFGFDCAHLGDLEPGMLALRAEMSLPDPAPDLFRETYKTVDYVREEVRSLAKQLAELATQGEVLDQLDI